FRHTLRIIFSFRGHLYSPALLSFPTRRSSDLADLGDCFIDGDATHFGCACRDDALLSDAALKDAGHLLHLAGQDDRQVLQPRNRSEEHTSELQSRFDLVCRLLLEKKNKTPMPR